MVILPSRVLLAPYSSDGGLPALYATLCTTLLSFAAVKDCAPSCTEPSLAMVSVRNSLPLPYDAVRETSVEPWPKRIRPAANSEPFRS